MPNNSGPLPVDLTAFRRRCRYCGKILAKNERQVHAQCGARHQAQQNRTPQPQMNRMQPPAWEAS